MMHFTMTHDYKYNYIIKLSGKYIEQIILNY